MKKFSSVLICFCLILSVVLSAPNVSAAEVYKGKITIGTVKGNPGDTVMVPIDLTENPGIMAITVSVKYDTRYITFTSMDFGDIFIDYTVAHHKDRSLIRLVICERNNKTNDGNIISFAFKIHEDAPAQLAPINLEYSKGDFCNWNLDKIMPTVVPGGVDINFNGKNCPHKSYSEWSVLSKPSCEDKGINQRECKKCGHLDYKEIAPIGHTFSENWTVDKPATAEKEGTMSRYCIRCDEYVDRISFSLTQADKENINNNIWEELPNKDLGEQLFKEQNPGEELTENTPSKENNKDSIFDPDSILNSITPSDGTISNSGAPTVSEKIAEAFPFYKSIFKMFGISFAVILYIIIF